MLHFLTLTKTESKKKCTNTTIIFRKQPFNSYSRRERLDPFHDASRPHTLAVAVALASKFLRGPHPARKFSPHYLHHIQPSTNIIVFTILDLSINQSNTNGQMAGKHNNIPLSPSPKSDKNHRAGYGARLRLLLTLLPGHESGVGSSPTLFSIRLAIVRYPRYSFLVIFWSFR